MIKNLSRALTCIFVGAALTACAGDDTGNTDTDPTTTASTSPTSSTSETGTTTDDSTTTDSTTTDPTTTTTDPTTTDSTTTTTTDPTTDSTTTTTTDPTTTTTDPTTTDPTTTTTDGGMGFEANVYPIISASCSCHVNGPKAGLTMPDAATAYANLVDVPSTQAPDVLRVAPGMPGASYIVNKIEGSHLDVGGAGAQMPLGGPLSPDKIMVFKDWIADGAMP